jgi:hypothetical protein
MTYDVICLGEAMGEIAFAPDGSTTVSVGGDTMNTAVYLARAGCRVAFASSVGPDPFGQRVTALLRDNDVSVAVLASVPDALAGSGSFITGALSPRRARLSAARLRPILNSSPKPSGSICPGSRSGCLRLTLTCCFP